MLRRLRSRSCFSRPLLSPRCRVARCGCWLLRNPAGHDRAQDMDGSSGNALHRPRPPAAGLATRTRRLIVCFNPQVFPLIAACGFASLLVGGMITKHFTGNTDVALDKKVRQDPNHQVYGSAATGARRACGLCERARCRAPPPFSICCICRASPTSTRPAPLALAGWNGTAHAAAQPPLWNVQHQQTSDRHLSLQLRPVPWCARLCAC